MGVHNIVQETVTKTSQRKGKAKQNCLRQPWTSLVAQMVKKPPAVSETWIRLLGWEDPLEESMASHFENRLWWTHRDSIVDIASTDNSLGFCDLVSCTSFHPVRCCIYTRLNLHTIYKYGKYACHCLSLSILDSLNFCPSQLSIPLSIFAQKAGKKATSSTDKDRWIEIAQ